MCTRANTHTHTHIHTHTHTHTHTQGGIPWGTLVVVGLGGLVLTGKLNVFTLIGEAVSGFVFVTVLRRP